MAPEIKLYKHLNNLTKLNKSSHETYIDDNNLPPFSRGGVVEVRVVERELLGGRFDV